MNRLVSCFSIRFDILILLSAAFSLTSNAQSLRGNITEDGKIPIPFATIYIDKTHFGTTANVNGEYELPLDSGSYHIKFRAIGYKIISQEVHINKKSVFLNITLPLEAYEMQEVVVRPNGENLADIIMRKAIAWAPYYLHYVEKYSSEVYLKGSMKLDNIPKILASSMEIRIDNKSIKPYSGMNFIDESISEVSYTAPDHFIQRVKSSRSTMPGFGGQPVTPMELIKETFYQPELMDCISPLNIDALKHYKFEYQGFSEEDNLLIYKIKVVPRRKSQQLFSGIIYIVDGHWCIYSVSLTAEPFWGSASISQVYTQFEGSAWLPMTHSFFIDASYLGIKGTYKYSAAVKYKDIKVNTTRPGPLKELTNANNSVISNKLTNVVTNKLNGIQMRKMAKKNRALAGTSKSDSTKSLEIQPHVKVSVEPGAMKQDSSFWNAIRPIPLTSEDIKGYEKFDSLLTQQKSISADSLSGKKQKSKFFGRLLAGKTWNIRDSTIHLRYFGPLNPRSFRFNTVDGWQYNQAISVRIEVDSIHEFRFQPEIGFAFSRKTLLGLIEGSYSYAPMRRGEFYFKAGSTSSDFNAGTGINPYVNSVFSLFLHDNYLKLFNYRYLALGNNIDLSNGLQLNTSISFNDYASLENNSSFSFFSHSSRRYSSNIPDNSYFKNDSIFSKKNITVNLNLEFTPEYYYVLRNNHKFMHESKYPTFRIGYRHSFSGSGSSFSLVEFGIKQTLDIGNWSMLRYAVQIGSFFNSNGILFPDYHHLNTQRQPVLIGSFFESFQLLDYYKYSCAGKFIEVQTQYRSQLLLLKRLPLISERIWSENLYLKYAASDRLQNYIEGGYGMGNILGVANIGIFLAYENFHYRALGIKLCLGIDNIR